MSRMCTVIDDIVRVNISMRGHESNVHCNRWCIYVKSINDFHQLSIILFKLWLNDLLPNFFDTVVLRILKKLITVSAWVAWQLSTSCPDDAAPSFAGVCTAPYWAYHNRQNPSVHIYELCISLCYTDVISLCIKRSNTYIIWHKRIEPLSVDEEEDDEYPNSDAEYQFCPARHDSKPGPHTQSHVSSTSDR